MTLTTLRARRLDLGLSQKAAGQLIGKSQSHFGKIEAGKLAMKATEAKALCDALGLTLNQLLTTEAESLFK